jgi:hypothetical protein
MARIKRIPTSATKRVRKQVAMDTPLVRTPLVVTRCRKTGDVFLEVFGGTEYGVGVWLSRKQARGLAVRLYGATQVAPLK